MKRLLILAAALTVSAAPALAADVGLSLNIGQPGFYGRLDIGDFPQPRVIYRQPRFIEPSARNRAPIYLRVPDAHRRNWRNHCREYRACGERVYFVQDNWYQHEYVPRYQERYVNHRDGRRDDYRSNRRGDQRDNRRHKNRDYGRDR